VLKLLTFEAMSDKHIGYVAEIEKLSFASPWSVEAFEAELANPAARYIIALSEGDVVGYCGYWRIFDEAHVTNVAIRPSDRGKGYGRAMTEELIRLALAEGVRHMTLEVRASNVRAQNLYRSLGFVGVGVRPRYYEDNNEDALIMWLELKEASEAGA